MTIGRSGDFLFVDQSNFFLNDYADRQPSSRNTHQEYSFHLYSGGTSPQSRHFWRNRETRTSIGKMSPSLPKRVRDLINDPDSLHIYSIGAPIRKEHEWTHWTGQNDVTVWPCSNLMQSQMELCELESNLDLKKKKKKKKRILGTQAPCLHVEDVF